MGQKLITINRRRISEGDAISFTRATAEIDSSSLFPLIFVGRVLAYTIVSFEQPKG